MRDTRKSNLHIPTNDVERLAEELEEQLKRRNEHQRRRKQAYIPDPQYLALFFLIKVGLE